MYLHFQLVLQSDWIKFKKLILLLLFPVIIFVEWKSTSCWHAGTRMILDEISKYSSKIRYTWNLTIFRVGWDGFVRTKYEAHRRYTSWHTKSFIHIKGHFILARTVEPSLLPYIYSRHRRDSLFLCLSHSRLILLYSRLSHSIIRGARVMSSYIPH